MAARAGAPTSRTPRKTVASFVFIDRTFRFSCRARSFAAAPSTCDGSFALEESGEVTQIRRDPCRTRAGVFLQGLLRIAHATGQPDRPHSGGGSAVDVVGEAIADVHRLVGRDPEIG